MKKSLLLLGASGNIGTQALDLLSLEKSPYELVGVSVGKNVKRLRELLSTWKGIRYAYAEDCREIDSLKCEFPNVSFFSGERGLGDIVAQSGADYVLNALVGFAGLLPSLVSAKLGKTLLLANKESLVVGGKLVIDGIRSAGGRLVPIDSEHVAFAKCLNALNGRKAKRFIITASGGPFYGKSPMELSKVTPEDALRHPTWNMGKKITIDSATMVNKGFELIEAAWLFDVDPSLIEVRVDRHSRVHSAIELEDGRFLADVGPSDMHGPIGFALDGGTGSEGVVECSDLSLIEGADFEPFDASSSEGILLPLEAFARGGTAPASLNAANEIAVSLFLSGKIPFLSIYKALRLSLGYPLLKKGTALTYDDLREADLESRELTSKAFAQ